MARFRSGGRVYEMTSLDEVTPRDLLTFPREASAVMGRPIKFADVERIAREIEALETEAEQDAHPDFDFLMTVVVWISRRAAGDKLTYDQCLDEPFEMLPEPKDHAGKASARKGSGKKKSSQGGGRATKRPASSAPAETTPARSEPRSADASAT